MLLAAARATASGGRTACFNCAVKIIRRFHAKHCELFSIAGRTDYVRGLREAGKSTLLIR